MMISQYSDTSEEPAPSSQFFELTGITHDGNQISSFLVCLPDVPFHQLPETHPSSSPVVFTVSTSSRTNSLLARRHLSYGVRKLPLKYF